MAAGQVGVLVTTESQVALFDRCMKALTLVVDDEEHKSALREVCGYTCCIYNMLWMHCIVIATTRHIVCDKIMQIKSKCGKLHCCITNFAQLMHFKADNREFSSV